MCRLPIRVHFTYNKATDLPRTHVSSLKTNPESHMHTCPLDRLIHKPFPHTFLLHFLIQSSPEAKMHMYRNYCGWFVDSLLQNNDYKCTSKMVKVQNIIKIRERGTLYCLRRSPYWPYNFWNDDRRTLTYSCPRSSLASHIALWI